MVLLYVKVAIKKQKIMDTKNREIKFRAWDKKVGGYFYFPEPINNVLAWMRINQDPEGYTIQQFTGLKDKLGKEIYEGDIVKNYGDIGFVEYYCNAFSIMVDIGVKTFLTAPKEREIRDLGISLHGGDIEVIGNIEGRFKVSGLPQPKEKKVCPECQFENGHSRECSKFVEQKNPSKEKKEAWVELTIEGAEQWLAKLGLLTSRGAKLLMVKKLIVQERKKVIEKIEGVKPQNTTTKTTEWFNGFSHCQKLIDEIIKRLK